MSRAQIFGLWAGLLVVMLACRCLPLILMQGRELPDRVKRAIALIPSASFAALVANDLVRPDEFAANPMLAVRLLVASAAVLLVARKSGSLVWCALVGMACYGALMLLPLG